MNSSINEKNDIKEVKIRNYIWKSGMYIKFKTACMYQDTMSLKLFYTIIIFNEQFSEGNSS